MNGRLAAALVSALVIAACGRGDDAHQNTPPEAGADSDPGAGSPSVASSAAEATVINGHELDSAAVEGLRGVGVLVVPGRFWYDPFSGAFGPEGGPTTGFTMPGLQVGGPLRPDASGGGTSVFVNGRELHPQEAGGLSLVLGPLVPGRYWLDAAGNWGVENGPMLGNLVLALRASGAAGGSFYLRETYGGYVGGDGTSSYYFDPTTGCSVISGGGVSC